MKHNTLILSIILLFFHINIFSQKLISYSVGFKIKNLGSTVNGSFKTGSATILIESKNKAASSFEGYVQTNSVNTGIKLRDTHLREKKEFFDTENYPKAKIKSVMVEVLPNGNFEVTWDLTIKSTTKRCKSIVYAVQKENEIALSTDIVINRNDWNVGGNSMTMSDKVTIVVRATVK